MEATEATGNGSPYYVLSPQGHTNGMLIEGPQTYGSPCNLHPCTVTTLDPTIHQSKTHPEVQLAETDCYSEYPVLPMGGRWVLLTAHDGNQSQHRPFS